MRVAAVADLHGHLPPVPPCDLLLLGGDLCPATDHTHDGQVRFLDGPFRAWLEQAPAARIVGIAGNHDFVFERAPERVPVDLPWTLLTDSATAVQGLTIFGSPWTPWFFDWAYNAPRGSQGEVFLAERYAAAPADTDVVLLHGPPRGHGDRTARGEDVGSTAALELVERVTPQLCVGGHIHEGRGVTCHGATTVANAAAVDLDYALVADPVMTFDLS